MLQVGPFVVDGSFPSAQERILLYLYTMEQGFVRGSSAEGPVVAGAVIKTTSKRRAYLQSSNILSEERSVTAWLLR